ncbi:MAG: cytochrome c biogenesis protein CcsA [Firmicutes bacterium]|nr:cytochrome c biogenesis protein CcsA [Bacillota bacterium]
MTKFTDHPTWKATVKTLSSLQLTILCLALLTALVVLCTLAQVNLGTFGAVNAYMRTWFVWWSPAQATWSLPVFPGGALVGLVLLINLVAALAVKFTFTWRKAGLWIVHAGLILLVAGEFISGALQVERRMVIRQGETVHFLESYRDMELVLTDVSDPAYDQVSAVPVSRLAKGGEVALPFTPLRLKVRRYFPNAALANLGAGDPSPLATQGVGLNVKAQELATVARDNEMNQPCAWIEPMAGDKSYGVWLASPLLGAPQAFTHEGRTYQISMRLQRDYLPYALTLKEFRHDVYPGTQIPKNFSSLVRLRNMENGEDRDVLIYMNQPLRYLGRTFYQSGYEGDTVTVLQVVQNPGWLLPYASCVIITAGLLIHFALSLGKMGSRQKLTTEARRDTEKNTEEDTERSTGKDVSTSKSWTLPRLLPWLAGTLAVLGTLALAIPSSSVRGFDMEAFGSLPVQEGGRIKPLDSVARNALLVIRSQQSYRAEGRTVQAEEWLADVLFRPRVADAQPIFVINDPDVLGLMKQPQTKERYFSFNVLAPHLDAIVQQAENAQHIEPQRRDRFQNALVNLYSRLQLYHRLRNSVQLMDSPGLALELASEHPQTQSRAFALSQLSFFRPLPPMVGETSEAWKNTGEALLTARSHPALPLLAQVGAAYATNEPTSFNGAVASLRQMHSNDARSHADHEQWFNRIQPFYAGIVIYVLALLTLFASWAWKREWLQPAAYGLLVGGALVHTAGLAFRIFLQGRPPVTNLYSSAVFVGWGTVILGVVLERIHRKGFGTAVAAASGIATLIIAQHLSTSGDTMEMMRAVLDSNFWLATHVITITIGYSGTFLAGALAIAYTLRKHLLKAPDAAATQALVNLTYGVICFALFFSFVGTVLGGIWADQSWGRFWGWDPKENGALVIVLWNAIILHARLAGYARERGIMAMAILGNIITALSWFGVNMLGVGLHSYGFMDQAFWALVLFSLSQMALAGACMTKKGLRSQL